MRPVATTFTGQVPAPIDRVFALLADPARLPQWLPGCTAAAAQAPLAKGRRVTVRFGTRSSLLEILEFSPPTGLGWVDREGRAGFQTFFKLQFGGGTTTVTIRYVWTPKSLGDVLRGRFLSRRNARRTFEAMIDNLRNLALK